MSALSSVRRQFACMNSHCQRAKKLQEDDKFLVDASTRRRADGDGVDDALLGRNTEEQIDPTTVQMRISALYGRVLFCACAAPGLSRLRA